MLGISGPQASHDGSFEQASLTFAVGSSQADSDKLQAQAQRTSRISAILAFLDGETDASAKRAAAESLAAEAAGVVHKPESILAALLAKMLKEQDERVLGLLLSSMIACQAENDLPEHKLAGPLAFALGSSRADGPAAAVLRYLSDQEANFALQRQYLGPAVFYQNQDSRPVQLQLLAAEYTEAWRRELDGAESRILLPCPDWKFVSSAEGLLANNLMLLLDTGIGRGAFEGSELLLPCLACVRGRCGLGSDRILGYGAWSD